MAAAVAFYEGKQDFAYINPSGKVCVNGGVVPRIKRQERRGPGHRPGIRASRWLKKLHQHIGQGVHVQPGQGE